MLFICEGNIGSGKTTFLNKLRDVHFIQPHVIVLEPVDQWMKQNVKNNKGDEQSVNFLELFYEDNIKHCFTFQMFALQSRMEYTLKIIQENPGKLIICERSPLTDCEIFAKMLFEKGILSAEDFCVYKKWYDFMLELIKPNIIGILYLQVEPNLCAKRIMQRNRDGEKNISLDYLQTLHDKHEKWLNNDNTEFVEIINNDDIEKTINFVNRTVEKHKKYEGI